MRLRPRRLLLSTFLLGISFASELNAQTTTSGGLTGVVTDASHAFVPDADIEIKDNAKGTTQSTKTDREGVYRFFFLAPSSYVLTLTHPGFRKESRAMNVLLGPPGTVNVTFEIAKTSSEITVTGEALLMQAENGDVSATMNQEQISEVPNPGNDLTYIAQTAPGAIMNTDSSLNTLGNFSILGMPSNSYIFTVDGMNNNDNSVNLSRSGALGLALGQNEIQEATVVTTGYSGQFGGAAGGNISYITKSGSSDFHGNAQYYWNGRVLNSNDWFIKESGNPRPFDNANQWAASLGGPIKQDKFFFFLDSEGMRLILPNVAPVVIPSPEFEAATIANIDSRFGLTSASDAFYKQIFRLYNAAPGASSALQGGQDPQADPTGCTGWIGPKTVQGQLGVDLPCALNFLSVRRRPSSDALTAGRVDWNTGKNDRAFLRIQYEDGLGAFFTDPISPLFDADNQGWQWQAQLIETHTFGSSAASQFLAAGTYSSGVDKVKDPSQALSAFPTSLNFSASGGFSALGGNDWIGAYGKHQTQYQLSEDMAKTWSKHKFGFGANFVRIDWKVLPNTVNATGQLFPQTLDAFYQGGLDSASPKTNFTRLTQSFTSQSTVPVSFFNLGLYGQDEWNAGSNLTLTFALRAEHYSNPTCESSCDSRLTGPFESISHDPGQPYNQAILVNQKHGVLSMDSILWSPRFSFAWQPLGVSRNSVLRGGVGIFYDPLAGGIQESFYINTPVYNVYTPFKNNLTPGETTNLFEDALTSNTTFVHGFGAGKTLAEMQAIDPNFSPPAITASENRIHSPEFQRWSLELQQGFGVDTSLSIGYFGNHGIRELVQDPDQNAFGFGSLPAAQPDLRFSEVTEYSSKAVSNYNGMVISFKHQFSGWTQGVIQANYTYGHAFDEVSNGGLFSFTTVGLTVPQDPRNLRGAYGPAEYDVRHSLNASYVWEIPVKAALGGHGSGYLVKGWQISGAIFARTGFPYTAVDVAQSSQLVGNNYFGLLYAVPVAPLPPSGACGEGAAYPLAPHPCQPPQVLSDGVTPNPNARFLQSGCETGFNEGNLGPLVPTSTCPGPTVALAQGRDHFRGPGYFNTDFAVMKNTKIRRWENATLGIGFQFFNLFNHPNFGFPDTASSDSTFGQIFNLEQPPTSIVGAGLGGDAAPRMIQLKAQLRF
ncbi:MAG TPA: carboxypeptidase regulatory-like domain-containing protein [Candidatus Acidoferrum sp.]